MYEYAKAIGANVIDGRRLLPLLRMRSLHPGTIQVKSKCLFKFTNYRIKMNCNVLTKEDENKKSLHVENNTLCQGLGYKV